MKLSASLYCVYEEEEFANEDFSSCVRKLRNENGNQKSVPKIANSDEDDEDQNLPSDRFKYGLIAN